MVDPEIMQAFLAESREHLAIVEDRILALESGSEDADVINELFRSLHTIKGSAGFVGLTSVSDLAHALEGVVTALRSGTLTPEPGLADGLLTGVDRLRQLVRNPEDPTVDVAAAIIECRSLLPDPGALITRNEDRTERTDPERKEAEPTGATVRIALPLLDRLMNLATELVLVRNQNVQAVETGNREQLFAISQRLSSVTSELQGCIMRTRMRPVGSVFGKFPRIVRDIARKLGKKVELETLGGEVELDKGIVEAIGDPLTHLIRNAVDHGIEDPETREKIGKPRRSRLRLSAYHESGRVMIRLEDDGHGIDPEAVRRAAVAKGLATPEQADAMADRDALRLIFTPGFSLASQVTDLSGRGVGLDVVKSGLKGLGGGIEIASVVGTGTTFTISLPLTLAIVPALVIAVEDLCFALPQVNIDEVVWLHGSEVHQNLKRVDDQEIYWLRDRMLPVLRLSRVLSIRKTWEDAETGLRIVERREQQPDRRHRESTVDPNRRSGPTERRTSLANSAYIVVIRLGEERYGLLVDSIVDTEEIVVKSLHEQLKGCGAFAGTTVLGDGRIAMVLDAAGVAETGHLRFGRIQQEECAARSTGAELRTLLLFDTGCSEVFGVPLSLVSRVEEVPPDRIHRADNRLYFEHGGRATPLVRMEDALDRRSGDYGDGLVSVIIPRGRRPIGIVASRILDTVEVGDDVDLETVASPGFVGSFLNEGRLVLLADLFHIIKRVEPDWFREEEDPNAEGRRILLVEDSRFFATLVVPALRSAGHDVVHAPDAEIAHDLVRREKFDIVLSDIELPGMSGFELARKLRADPKTRDLPLIAISSIHDQSIESDARGAGFDCFESKLDQGRLLDSLRSLCAGPVPVRES